MVDREYEDTPGTHEEVLRLFAQSEDNHGLLGVRKENNTLIHALLLTRRKGLGLTHKELARKAGTNSATISRIENLLQFPNEALREQLAAVLEMEANELFPLWLQELLPKQYHKERRKPVILFEIVHEDTLSRQQLLAGQRIMEEYGTISVDPHGQAERRDLRDSIVGDDSPLNPRQKDVLIKRFGLGGEAIYPLQAVGKELGVTKERVRAIEEVALQRIKGNFLVAENLSDYRREFLEEKKPSTNIKREVSNEAFSASVPKDALAEQSVSQQPPGEQQTTHSRGDFYQRVKQKLKKVLRFFKL